MSARILNVLLIVGLVFPSVPLPIVNATTINTPTQIVALTDIAATINITNTGFDPAQVTIRVGETVEWVNITAEVQRVSGGVPYYIYLPLVLRNRGDTDASASQSATTASPVTLDWGSGDIQPGGRFTYTFATVGAYPYFLAGQINLTGLIVVEDELEPDFVLSVVPTSQEVLSGEFVTYTVALTATHNFSSPVTLSVSGLPVDVTALWHHNPVTPTGTTILTLTTLNATPAGAYPLTVMGLSGALFHSVPFELVVNEMACEALTDVSYTADAPVMLGESMTFTATTTPVTATEPVTYLWDFGVGGIIGENIITHTFDVTGTHPITLTAENPCGMASFSDTVEVIAPSICTPIMDANILSDSPVELGTPLYFTATISPVDATLPLVYTWDFGDDIVLGNQLMTYTFPTTGTYAITLTVDNPCSSVTVTDTVHIVDVSPKPDLLIPTTGIEPLMPTVGQVTTLTMQVKNQGSVSTSVGVRVDAYFTTTLPVTGQVGELSTVLPSLDAGQVISVLMFYTPTSSGFQTVYAQVDPLDTVFESIEVNNIGGPLTFTVQPSMPDLVVESITFEPTVGWLNEPVTITVQVHNQGSADAGAFRVDWYVDLAMPPVAGQTGDGYWDVPGLPANTTTVLTLTYIFSSVGPHQLYAQADTLDSITESLETNNVDNSSIAVVDRYVDWCGNITIDTTWEAGVIHRVICDVSINNGITLTVEPGAVVQFYNGYGLNVYGVLSAIGQENEVIQFTSYYVNPSKGNWDGIAVYADGQAMLDYVSVKYAGNTGTIYDALVYVADGGALQLSNSELAYSDQYGVRVEEEHGIVINSSKVHDCDSYGIYVYDDADGDPTEPNLEDNVLNNNTYPIYVNSQYLTGQSTIANNMGVNNGTDGILIGGNFTGTTLLAANPGLPYVFAGVNVPAGQALQLEPRVVVKFNSGGYLLVYGTLDAAGTAESPVVFTSIQDDTYGGDTNNDGDTSSPAPGNWYRIYIASGAATTLTHTIVHYGGYYNGTTYPMLHSYGTLNLDNCDVRYGQSAAIGSNAGSLSVANSTIGFSIDGIRASNTAVLIRNSTLISNTMDGIVINYQGKTGTPIVQGNTFVDNGYYAATISASESGSYLTSQSIADNTGSNNDINGIYIGGNLTGTTLLAANPGLPYVFAGVNVPAGQKLQLEPGAVVKINSGSYLLVYGTLDARGTAGSPVVFTSVQDDAYGGDTNNDDDATSPAPGNWHRIYIAAGGAATLTHTVIQYGGYYDSSTSPMLHSYGDLSLDNCDVRYGQSAAIGSNAGSLFVTDAIVGFSYDGIRASNTEVLIRNSTLISNTDEGIVITYQNRTGVPVIEQNTFIGNGYYAATISASESGSYLTSQSIANNTGSNNGTNGIYIAGNLTGTTLLAANPGLPYVFAGVNVPAGQALQFEPGTVVKPNSGGYLLVYGTLDARGTVESPVVFTSVKDDNYGGDTNNDGDATSPAPGNWYRIYIASSGTATLTHTIAHYGGYYNGTTNPMLHSYGTLSLDNCDVRYGQSTAIGSNAGSLSVANSTIGFSYDGMRVSVNSIIHNNRIYGNTGYGVYNANTANYVDARNNWWGSDSGPSPYGSGDAINYTTSCSAGICTIIPRVNVVPWLGQKTYLGQSVPNVVYESDPVNTANGNYAYGHTDIGIPVRGLLLDFTRYYNSTITETGPLGYGWHHNWLVTVEETGDLVFVTFGDGHQVRFTWDGSVYEPAPGVFASLTKVIEHFELTGKDQTTYVFNTNGQLTSVADRNGNTTTLSYDGQDRLATIAEPAGRILSLSYTSPISSAFLTQVLDPTGRTIQYTYNITGDLTLVTDTTGCTTTYHYDDQHRMLSITDANGHTFVTNEYNTSGRVVKQWDGLGNLTTFAYDEPTHKTIVTDPLGRKTTYQYDSLLRLTSETDALNHSALYVYDTDNNRTQVTDKRGFITLLDHDDWGNTTLITDALGGKLIFVYNAYNQPTRVTDPLSHTTVYTYNAAGDLVVSQDALGSVSRWAYNPYGQVTSITDALTRTTYYGYDVYGYRSSITDALGNTTTFIFDNVGRQLSETDATGQVITYTYDNANRLLSIHEPQGRLTQYAYDKVGNQLSITDPRDGITTFGYDDKDRLITTTDQLGQTTSYGYDPVNSLITQTNALGHTTIFGYDALNRKVSITDPLTHTTAHAYDANGNRISITDANGNATSYTYDALGRLLTVTDAEGGVVTYGYDAIGNRTILTDANGHITTYAYDALSRLIGTTNPLSHTTVYTYDVVGNRVARQKPDGTVLQYTYDRLDRLAAINALDLAIDYAYDEIGNRTVMTDSTGITTYDYDALYRLTQVTAPTGTLQYGYDLNGNRTHLTYPDGNVVTYTYDLANRLTDVTDWNSRVVTYIYDDAGRQVAVQYPNNTQATYTYDDAGGLLSLRHTSLVSDTIGVFTYTLDAVGNRLTMEDLQGTTAYTYDDLYRLLGVTYLDAETVTYSYDPMGNRTAMTSTVTGVVTYTYDAADRLLSFNDAAGTTPLTWDENGNMVGKDSTVYTFDAFDRLTQVISGTTDVRFTYNGDGVRVGKTVNELVTDYVQDVAAPSPLVVAEITSNGTDQYVYGNDLVSAEDATGEVAHYHQDGLGSTRGLSNEAGELTDTYTYDAFGSLRNHTGNNCQDFTFTGEQVDGELRLVFLRARYYDPMTGRFITADPHQGIATDTRSQNDYTYAINNPILLIDDDGELAHIVATTLAGAGWGLFSQAASDVYEYVFTDSVDVDWKDYVAAGTGGAVKGALAGIGCVGPCKHLVGTAVGSIVKTGFHDLLADERSSLGVYAGDVGRSVVSEYASRVLAPGAPEHSPVWYKFIHEAGQKALKSLVSFGIKELFDPKPTYAFSIDSYISDGGTRGGGGGSWVSEDRFAWTGWGGPPSQDK